MMNGSSSTGMATVMMMKMNHMVTTTFFVVVLLLVASNTIVAQATDVEQRRSLQTAGCPAGTFKSSLEAIAPCIPCLRCAWNQVQLIECVTFPPDTNQCQCMDGFVSNGKAGCLPINTNGSNMESVPYSAGTVNVAATGTTTFLLMAGYFYLQQW